MCASVQVPTSAAAAAPLPAAPCRAADTDQQYSGPEWEQYKRDTAQVRWLQPARPWQLPSKSAWGAWRCSTEP